MSEPDPYFPIAMCVLVGFWLLALGEFVGTLCFWPWVFRAGICVWRESRLLPVPTADVGATFATATGKFKVIGPGVCMFRWKMPWFSSELETPLMFKCALRWNGSQATAEGRIPLFTTLFAGGWLALLICGAAHSGIIPGTCIFLVGTCFLAGFWFWSLSFEIRRAEQILREYEALHTEQPPSDTDKPKRVDQFGQIHRSENSGGSTPSA